MEPAGTSAVPLQGAPASAPVDAWTSGPTRRSRVRLPWVALILLLPILVSGVFGPWLYPHDPAAADFDQVLRPPAWLPGGELAYLLGTDTLGRDLLSRMMQGARATLLVATVGVLGAACIGVPLGVVAGYAGGWLDNLVMRVADVKLAIPAVLLIILIASVTGGGLYTILFSIMIVFWAGYARVLRGETLALRERPFIQLARVANCSHRRILLRHVLPNVMPTIIVLVTLQVGPAIMVEAGISFLGLGVQPPLAAWGLLINDGRSVLEVAWWLTVFPGIAVMVTVLGANLLGDWLSATLDPRRRPRS